MMNWLSRQLDVRADERRPVLATFVSLLLIVSGHTALETVRDALFLTYIGPQGLGPMYIVAAALTLGIGSVSAGIGARFGARRALITTQIAAAIGALVFFALPPSRGTLMAMYGFSAVVGALVVPQLWATAAGLFHAAQSRRLFGTIALAGILGAVTGSALSAALLTVVSVTSLLLFSSAVFAGSAAAIGMIGRAAEVRLAEPMRGAWCKRGGADKVVKRTSWVSAMREEPVLLRMALVVALGSITTLLVDFAFKTAVAAKIPSSDLGAFFARYSAIMNVAAFVVHLLFAKRVLARVGVIGTAAFMPSLLFFGGVVTVLTGGSLLAVLGTKVVDASLRHSVHRTGSELVYQAVPARARDRAKPFIDGAVARVSQAVAASLVLLLGYLGWADVRRLAVVATVFAAAWGAATYALRAPYIGLFRRTLLGDPLATDRSDQELDLASVELLVEALSSPRPREVVAAMNALARRDRAGVVPALILLVEDEDVLERALELFGSSRRKDWFPFAEKLTEDKRERVRRAALRALARVHVPEGRSPSSVPPLRPDERPWILGYLAATSHVRNATEDGEKRVYELVDADPEAPLFASGAGEARLGALTALGDARVEAEGPTHADGERAIALLRSLIESTPRERMSSEIVAQAARAAGNLKAVVLLPWLVARLAARDGRAAVRASLAKIGGPAEEALTSALLDRDTPREVRIHLPRTLAMFESQAAADVLMSILSGDPDGLVRYKSLRALGRVVVDGHAKLGFAALRKLARRDLVEHFRLLSLLDSLVRAERGRESSTGGRALDAVGYATQRLIIRLLEEKARQALERAFRLLKLCFPDEDIHRVHTAAIAGDDASRATAMEFLDALLAPRRRNDREDDVRPLLRLVTEALPNAERVARAAELAGSQIRVLEPSAAVRALLEDQDSTMVALAAALLQTGTARSVERASQPPARAVAEQRPSVAEAVERLLGPISSRGAVMQQDHARG